MGVFETHGIYVSKLVIIFSNHPVVQVVVHPVQVIYMTQNQCNMTIKELGVWVITYN
jgi:hypothetical protein